MSWPNSGQSISINRCALDLAAMEFDFLFYSQKRWEQEASTKANIIREHSAPASALVFICVAAEKPEII